MSRYQTRLRKLSIEHLGKSIIAMKEVLAEYEGGIKQGDCALCRMVDRDKSGGPICKQCPWLVMKGVRCTGYLDRWWIYYHKCCIYSLRRGRNSRWTRMRIRQLTKWIESYQIALGLKVLREKTLETIEL